MRETRSLSRESGKIMEAVLILIATPGFESAVGEIRHKWNIKWWMDQEGYVKEYGKSGKNFIEKTVNNKNFQQQLRDIMARFSLHIGWLDWLEAYVMWNQPDIGDPEAPQLEIGYGEPDNDPITREKTYLLRIYPSTTLANIKKTWPIIKAGGIKTKKYKPWKNFKRDKDIYDLASEGKTIAEIARIIHAKYGGGVLTYGNIKKIVSTYQTKMKIPKDLKVSKLRTR